MTNVSYVVASVKADVCDCDEKEIHKRKRNFHNTGWIEIGPVCSLLTFPLPVSMEIVYNSVLTLYELIHFTICGFMGSLWTKPKTYKHTNRVVL